MFFRTGLRWSRVHPIALSLGKFAIHWYGVLVAIGFVLGFWTASRRAPRDGIAPDTIMDFAPWLLIGAVIGARLLHVISYWNEEFAGRPFINVFMIQKGGLVFYGGFAGALIATIFYSHRRGLPLWKVADIFAPSVSLGHFFGRFGCLMTGCCYGRPSDLPWAIHFPPGHDTYPTGVHPVQVYEALLNLALYGGLAFLYRRKKFDGQVFATYLVCYAVLRMFVELFRADYRPGEFLFYGSLKPGQTVSMLVLAGGLFLFWMLRRKPAPAA